MLDHVALFGPTSLTAADCALRQNLTLGQCPWFDELCRLLPVPILILNADDTVVLANGALLRLAELPRQTDLVGCSADPERLAELGLVARPLRAAGEPYRLLTLDGQGRRSSLERMFFHDLLNTAGGVQGLSEVMADAPPEELPRLTTAVRDLADQLVEEISAHRDLAAAETGELQVERRPLQAAEILRMVAARYRGHPVSGDRQIVVVPGPGGGVAHSDPVILGRILGNLVKNALEAVPEGASVTLDSGRSAGSVWFSVHNPGEIAARHLQRVFEREFSTKGQGRGLGTYSVKILAESYLRGRVAFTSDAARGTTFTVSVPVGGP